MPIGGRGGLLLFMALLLLEVWPAPSRAYCPLVVSVEVDLDPPFQETPALSRLNIIVGTSISWMCTVRPRASIGDRVG